MASFVDGFEIVGGTLRRAADANLTAPEVRRSCALFDGPLRRRIDSTGIGGVGMEGSEPPASAATIAVLMMSVVGILGTATTFALLALLVCIELLNDLLELAHEVPQAIDAHRHMRDGHDRQDHPLNICRRGHRARFEVEENRVHVSEGEVDSVGHVRSRERRSAEARKELVHSLRLRHVIDNPLCSEAVGGLALGHGSSMPEPKDPRAQRRSPGYKRQRFRAIVSMFGHRAVTTAHPHAGGEGAVQSVLSSN